VYYIFIQNSDNTIIGSGQVKLLDINVNVVEVTKEIYDLFNRDREAVIYDSENNEVIENPSYDEILAHRREEEFNQAFFETSVGYIRRKATMKDGFTQKDFISDLLPLMEGTPGVPIIVYEKPDFTQEVTEEVLIGLQKIVQSTPELIQECKNQAIIDFYGYNPMDMLPINPPEGDIEE
jgi:hypothetical protein